MLGTTMRRGPILVVDDDPDLCNLIRRALEHDGHRVITASDGFEAINAYETDRPSMIFVDLMMPRLDGEQFLRMLGTPRPPVVLVSASVRREEVAKERSLDDSLSKPFEVKAVKALAKKFLGEPPPG